MRILALSALALVCATGLFAQGNAPTITVTSVGVTVPPGGGINVVEGSFLNGIQLVFQVNDVDGGTVSIAATVSNQAQCINWSSADLSRNPTTVPYTHNVITTNGQFNSAGIVHNISLTVSDGTNNTVFNFSITIIAATGGTSGGGGGGGGGCVAREDFLNGAALLGSLAALFAIRVLRRKAALL